MRHERAAAAKRSTLLEDLAMGVAGFAACLIVIVGLAIWTNYVAGSSHRDPRRRSHRAADRATSGLNVLLGYTLWAPSVTSRCSATSQARWQKSDSVCSSTSGSGNEVEGQLRQAKDEAERRAAIQRAEELRPDVVLLDIGMPEVSGYDVARAIRREAWVELDVLEEVLQMSTSTPISGKSQPTS